jgi:hypothetical protein
MTYPDNLTENEVEFYRSVVCELAESQLMGTYKYHRCFCCACRRFVRVARWKGIYADCPTCAGRVLSAETLAALIKRCAVVVSKE